MFQASVAAHPDAPLIHYFGTTLSVADVDRASDALAAALVADGFAAGDRVAVYLQNVPQFVLTVRGHLEGRRHRRADQPDEQGARAHLRPRGLGGVGARDAWRRSTTTS